MKIIDFRSDTITKPTEEMRKAMYNAEVGDDIYNEDPTVNKLEEMAAERVGKEAALFVPSGTMGNQLALLTHTSRGQEIVLEDWSHIYRFEVGGLAFLSGLQAKTIKGINGIMDVDDVKNNIAKDNDIHHPQTGLICLENTHNMAGGVVIPINNIREIYNVAKNYDLPVHMDGARIFNASMYLNCDVKEITKYTDSIMFCLSKGLCAPVGSILAGDKDFINRARSYRKMLGGGMRQAGVLAAAGIIAMEEMVQRLGEDHENIKLLAEKLGDIKGVNINFKTVQTNILMIDIKETGYEAQELVNLMKEKGILTTKITNTKIRFVTHRHIERDDVEYSANIIKDLLE